MKTKSKCSFRHLSELFLPYITDTYKGSKPITVDLPRDMIIVVLRGQTSVIRKSDGLMVLDMRGEVIFGINRILGVFINDYSIVINGDYEYFLMSALQAKTLVDINDEWYHVAFAISYLTKEYAQRDLISSKKSVYEIIKCHLLNLWGLPYEQRIKISLYKYILSRTAISRSALHKVIFELNYGGYIQTNRGQLLQVNKLPELY